MKPLDNAESCFLCRRRSSAFGVGARRIGWLCAECGPQLGRKAMAMTERDFDEYEARALVAAGDMAGVYLDGLGRTDLATLAPEEWRRFLAIVVRSFGDGIRREIGRGIVRDGFGEVIHAHLTTEEIQDAEPIADGT